MEKSDEQKIKYTNEYFQLNGHMPESFPSDPQAGIINIYGLSFPMSYLFAGGGLLLIFLIK